MNKKGFTLIELLVVISIIAILSAGGFVSYQGVRTRTIEAKVKADIDSIKKAYEANYDPGLFGGQGGYKPISGLDFASAKIPTPDDTESTTYIVVGSYVKTGSPTPSPTTGFGACVDTITGQACTYPAGSCKCVQSTQGIGSVDFLTQPSNAVHSESFENDSDNDGLANGWTKVWVGGPPAGSIASYSRVSPGFDKNYSQKVTSAQTTEGLYYWSVTLQPNTKYTYSAWVKLTGVTGSMGGVDIRVALNSGGCGVVGSPQLAQLNQYTKLSVTFTTCDATTVWATLVIRPVEAGENPANTASYEADAIQVVKEN